MFLIINYDKSNQGGSHWVSVVKNGNDVYNFGSFGIPALHEIKNHFAKYNIYYDDRPVQQIGSSICGHLCLAFIEHMVLTKKTFYQSLSDCLEKSNRYKDDLK